MDTSQILLTAVVGVGASIVTALVTHFLTRAQERKRFEREIVGKLAEMGSPERAQTMVMAVQYGHSCLIVKRPDPEEGERVFLPMGSRITLGRDRSSHIRLDYPQVSGMHAALRAQGDHAYVEPLAPTMGLELNGKLVLQPRKLKTGDVITVPDAPFTITFVKLVA